MGSNVKRVRNAKTSVKRRAMNRAKDKVQRRHRDSATSREFTDGNTLAANHQQGSQQGLVGSGDVLLAGLDMRAGERAKRQGRRHREQFSTPVAQPGEYAGAAPGEAGAYVHYYLRQYTGWSMLRGMGERSDTERDYEG